jgi:maleate isomerase
VAALACTSVSFVRGAGFDQEIIDRIATASGALATTTSTAAVRALDALGIHTIVALDPHISAIGERLQRFLEAARIHVVRVHKLELVNCEEIASLSAAEVVAIVRAIDHPDANGILISCTNVHTVDAIVELEETLGKPVVSANQATLWDALRLAGVEHRNGIGRLWQTSYRV